MIMTKIAIKKKIGKQLYIPELISSDYHLFGNLNYHLHGARFRDNEELETATQILVWGPTRRLLIEKPTLLKTKQAKFIEVKKDYIEK